MAKSLPEYAVQISIAVAFWLLIVNAKREGHRWLSTLLWGIVFGFAVEYVNIHATPAPYVYPSCPVEGGSPGSVLCVRGVALWVPIGWGEILYLSTWTAQRLRIHRFVKPVAAAFLAVNFDLTLDPTAQALHLWTWYEPPPYYTLFGVPFDNFVGWYLIVSLYALIARLLLGFGGRRRGGSDAASREPWLDFVLGAAAAGISFGAYALVRNWIASKGAYHDDGTTAARIFIFVTVVVAGFTWFHAFRSRRDHEINWAPLLIPAFFHALCFVLLAVTGAWRAQPAMLVAIPSNLAIGFMLYAWSSLESVFRFVAPKPVLSAVALPVRNQGPRLAASDEVAERRGA